MTEEEDVRSAEESVPHVLNKKVLIEEIDEQEAILVDVSGGKLIEAIEECQERKDDKSKDMVEDFKNLNSEFDSLD